jgi:hypothetical protein
VNEQNNKILLFVGGKVRKKFGGEGKRIYFCLGSECEFLPCCVRVV